MGHQKAARFACNDRRHQSGDRRSRKRDPRWTSSACAGATSIRVEVADALKLPYQDGSFDISISSLFLHHLKSDDCAAALAQMDRVAKHGIVLNALQRSPLADVACKLLGSFLPMTPMIRHDGLVSILRAFTGREMLAIAQAAKM